MRELHYGTGVLTVSFDVCSAVFDYAVALANAGKTDRVTVPVLVEGERGFSNLLLGPTTQLYCSAFHDGQVPGGPSVHETDLEDTELIHDLVRKGALLTHHPHVTPSNGLLGFDLEGYDHPEL